MHTSSLQEVRTDIKCLLISSQAGVTVASLDKDYKEQNGRSIPYRELGYNNLEQFLRSMPDVVRFVGHGGGPQAPLAAVVDKKQEHISNLVALNKRDSRDKRKPRRVAVKVDSARNFRRAREENDYDEWNKPSSHQSQATKPPPPLEDLCQPVKSPKRVLRHSKEKDPELSDDEIGHTTPSQPIRYSSIQENINIVRFGAKIPEPSFRKEVRNHEPFRIFIAEMHNPFRFWFHFMDETRSLDEMMIDLDDRYAEMPPEELQMPLENVVPGHYVAVRYRAKWHRGLIVTKPEESKVKVVLFDYGTTSSVPLANVKFLLDTFAHLPKRAHRGSLAEILPASGTWTGDATLDIVNLVKGGQSLAAVCERLDEQQKVYHLVVNDDENPKNVVHFGRFLVECGHASWREDKPRYINRLHHNEIHPSFDHLECVKF